MTTEKKTTRSPVVVILGHVDHGKTTLLDFIRKSNVAQKETGGITQHIGAYQIEHAGRLVTFLDTPGHEAFSEMRRRGARVADIAVLVVAADESIKPQTLEAAACITETEIPFVVALNKIDKPGADINRVKKDLSEHNILIEEWGGNVPALEISAKTGKGVPELLDMLLLMWDMQEETEEAENTDAEGMGGPRSVGKGVVIESRLDSRRGAIATVLVTFGEFKKNDAVLCGASVGKIKLLEDFKGEEIDVARAATPVRIMGLETVPVLGDTCVVAGNLEEARAAGALSQQKIDEERKEVLARIAAAAQSAKKILAIILSLALVSFSTNGWIWWSRCSIVCDYRSRFLALGPSLIDCGRWLCQTFSFSDVFQTQKKLRCCPMQRHLSIPKSKIQALPRSNLWQAVGR